jgi:hypothetical protein
MFYHVSIGITGVTTGLQRNMTREEVLKNLLCPFVNREITILDGEIFNTSSYGSIKVFQTTRPIDSDWPVKKSVTQDAISTWHYEEEITKAFKNEATDVTQELYREAIMMIDSGLTCPPKTIPVIIS